MSERSRRHQAGHELKGEFEKFKRNRRARSADDSSSDSDSSSESAEYSDGQLDDDDDFVADGHYADDFENEKETKKKKQPEKKGTLFEFMEKTKHAQEKRRQAAPSTKSSRNDDTELNNLLAEFTKDDTSQHRKRQQKRQLKQKQRSRAEFTSHYAKDENEFEQPDEEMPPPPPPMEENAPEVKPAAPVVVEERREIVAPPRPAFDIEAVSGEGLDLTGDAVESVERVEIPIPESGDMDMFLYHVHEEEGQLYLFCKYNLDGKYHTVCVRVVLVYYTLQFLPIDGQVEPLIEEVKTVARRCKGACLGDPVVQRMKYCFDNASVDRDAEWVVAHFSPKARMQDVPMEGNHYSNVFGITATLAEGFLLRTKIMGPCWIRIHNAQMDKQVSSVPMVTIKKGEFVEVLEGSTLPIPPFNLCSFALRASFNPQKKENQVFMISMDFKVDWDIENFKSAGETNKGARLTYVCPVAGTGLNSDYVAEVRKNDRMKNIVVFEKERDLLEAFANKLEEMDVDLIASYGLTTFDMPLILERLNKHNVQTFWKIGRLKRGRGSGKTKLEVAMAGRLPVDARVMCSEFWRSKANDFSSIVKDIFGDSRQVIDHFDVVPKLSDYDSLKNLVNYNGRDAFWVSQIIKKIQILPLTLQISKLSGCPWQRVLLGKASPRCETLLLHMFTLFHYVVPEKQKAEGILKREAKYKGGKVLSPERGFYETCVCVLDFNSLYPSIIREYNICFTTVDKSNPNAKAARAKREKEKKEGILPQIMERLLQARQTVKQDLAKCNQRLEAATDSKIQEAIRVEIVRLQIKEKAIKVLANSMYGYLGFKSSRFQANHLAALITECGREILEDTAKFMENQQYKVVYGDTDSVMINSNTKDPVEATRIAQELSMKISSKYRFLKLGVDYVFQKMLLVAKKKYAAMVYLGPGKTRIDKKGLDMVRRDWSEVTKKLSEFIIGEFMSGNEKDEANRLVLQELETVAKMMHNGGAAVERESQTFPDGISISDLAITKALKKALDQYPMSNASAHVVVARRMAEKGENVAPNATIEYVVCKSEARDLGSKARLPVEVGNFAEADIDWYLANQLLHPLWRLCEPFGGMTIGMLSQALGLHYATPVIESSGARRGNSTAALPRLCELTFQCVGCQRLNAFDADRDPKEWLVCQNSECNFSHNWKYVANQLTMCVRRFLTELRTDKVKEDVKTFKCSGILCNYKTAQLPVRAVAPAHYNAYKQSEKICGGQLRPIASSTEIYNTLRYWTEIFKPPTEVGCADEHKDFRTYMHDYLNAVLATHCFSKLSLRALFAPQVPVVHHEEEDDAEDSD